MGHPVTLHGSAELSLRCIAEATCGRSTPVSRRDSCAIFGNNGASGGVHPSLPFSLNALPCLCRMGSITRARWALPEPKPDLDPDPEPRRPYP